MLGHPSHPPSCSVACAGQSLLSDGLKGATQPPGAPLPISSFISGCLSDRPALSRAEVSAVRCRMKAWARHPRSLLGGSGTLLPNKEKVWPERTRLARNPAEHRQQPLPLGRDPGGLLPSGISGRNANEVSQNQANFHGGKRKNLLQKTELTFKYWL